MRRAAMLAPALLALTACASEPNSTSPAATSTAMTTQVPSAEQITDGAYTFCLGKITEQLRSPATAQFSDRSLSDEAVDGNTYLFRGTVDSENGFGALGRSDWACSVEYNPETHQMNAVIASVS